MPGEFNNGKMSSAQSLLHVVETRDLAIVVAVSYSPMRRHPEQIIESFYLSVEKFIIVFFFFQFFPKEKKQANWNKHSMCET